MNPTSQFTPQVDVAAQRLAALNEIIHVPLDTGSPPIEVEGWDELEKLSLPQWIWHKIIQSDAVTLLVGAPASFKTFLALFLMASITLGRDYAGRRITQGKVLYLIAEGRRSLFERLLAIATHLELSRIDGLHIISSAPQIGEMGAKEELLAVIQELKPDVVFIDTAFKHFAAFDPGHTTGAQAIVSTCEAIRRACDCAVILIHHPPKGGRNQVEHGAAPLMAGVDTAIFVATNKTKSALTLRCMKQKSDEEFAPFSLRIAHVPIVRDGMPLRIPVVTGDIGPCHSEEPHSANVEGALLRVLGVIAKLADKAMPKNVCAEAEISESHFHRFKTTLLERNWITQTGERRPYQVTEKGYEALKGFSSEVHGS